MSSIFDLLYVCCIWYKTSTDLRGTRCTPKSYARSHFRPNTNVKLFRPTPLLDTLATLSRLSIPHDTHTPTLWSHPKPFYLHVTSLNHKPAPTHRIPSTIRLMNDLRHRPTHDSSMFFTENAESRAWTVASALSSSSSDQRHPWWLLPRIGDLPPDSNAVLDMQAVAAVESRRMGAAASALAFYSTMPRNSKPLHPPPSRTDKEAHTAFRSAFGRALSEELTLYRNPPPWSTLDNLAAIEHIVPPTANQNKRPRMEIDDALMTASDAKRQGHAKQAVQAIWGMVERRKSTSSDETSAKKKATSILGNPFLRKMVKSDFEELEADEPPPILRASRAKKQDDNDTNPPERIENDDDTSNAVQISTFPVPSPITKPLRPISTLSIPMRPVDVPTATPAEQSKSSNARSSRSLDQRTTQMKLSVFAGDAANKEQPSSRSLPRSSSSSVDAKSADSRVVSKENPEKEAARTVHQKRKSTGSQRFDWKNWGTG